MKKSPGRESIVSGTQISGWPWPWWRWWEWRWWQVMIIRMMTMRNGDCAHGFGQVAELRLALSRTPTEPWMLPILDWVTWLLGSPTDDDRYDDDIIIAMIIISIISIIMRLFRHQYHRSKVLSGPSWQVHCKDSLAHSVSNLQGDAITCFMMLTRMMMMVIIYHDPVKIHDNPQNWTRESWSLWPTPKLLQSQSNAITYIWYIMMLMKLKC